MTDQPDYDPNDELRECDGCGELFPLASLDDGYCEVCGIYLSREHEARMASRRAARNIYKSRGDEE